MKKRVRGKNCNFKIFPTASWKNFEIRRESWLFFVVAIIQTPSQPLVITFARILCRKEGIFFSMCQIKKALENWL